MTQVWVQRLGWTLLHFLWQGTVIAAVYAVLRGLTGRSLSSQGRYRLACVALSAMAVAPFVTFLMLPQTADSVLVISWSVSASAWQQFLPGFVAFWFSGVLAFSIRLFGGWRFTARARFTSHPAPSEWQQALERIGERADVRLLVSSMVDVPTVIGWLRPVILVPVEFFTGLPPEHVMALLAHEMAHIKRQDYLASILQSLAESVLFYHPAIWWVSEQIRAEREACCDDLAVAASGDALTYARALAQLETIQQPRLKTALAANGGSLVNRIRRLIEPAQPPTDSLPGAGAAWAMTLLWIVGVGVATVHAAQPTPNHLQTTVVATPGVVPEWQPSPFPAPVGPANVSSALGKHVRDTVLFDPFLSAQALPPQTAGRATANSGSEWNLWLNNDVVYIISGEERNAFLQVGTDEERQQFAEQFWLRRDPTPGTAENEFKEEHYRRIAYANQHYGSSLPGWKTDRGRIYITLGPPDEIESHAAGAQPFSVEDWRYNHLEGQGSGLLIEFDDSANKGEYRIAKSQPDTNQAMAEFNRMAQFFRQQRFQEPDALAGAQNGVASFPMKVQIDYLRGTPSSVLVNITVQVEGKDLQFQTNNGVDKAVVNMFGRVTSMTRRPITTFEPTLEIVQPQGAAHDQVMQVYQQSVPLAPGRYRFSMVGKDVASGKTGTWETEADVPHFDEGKLGASSLILADTIEKVASRPGGGSMFVIGDSRIRPRVGARFTSKEKMGVYVQIYNFTPDARTQMPSGSIEYVVARAGSFIKVIDVSEEVGSIPNASASQVTVQKLLPLTTLVPGVYSLTVTGDGSEWRSDGSAVGEF